MAKKKQTIKPIDEPYGGVFYTDGGCRPNPGYGGWGMHGYIYSNNQPDKGSGNPTHVPTVHGYVFKSEIKQQSAEAGTYVIVKPLSYVDGYGGFSEITTNNVGEIAGILNALKTAYENNLKKICILTDSEMAIKGVTEWLPVWKRNNWIKSDGCLVSNQDMWKKVDELIQLLKEKQVKIKFQWVRGHNGDLGNALSDYRATMGVYKSRQLCMSGAGENHGVTIKTDAAGYWKPYDLKHPFISLDILYFTLTADTPGIYHLSTKAKDDEMIGKRDPDFTACYMMLKDPCPILETVKQKQAKLTPGSTSLFLARVDRLYDPNVSKDIHRFGSDALVSSNKNSNDLYHPDKTPLSRELNVPRIAWRAVEEINRLCYLLESFKINSAEYFYEEITHLFYEKDDKDKTTLLSSIQNDNLQKTIQAHYKDDITLEIEKIELQITIGLDTLDRNNLKRLEPFNPKIYLLTTCESSAVVRYWTIIKTDNDIGIWGAVYSNNRIVKK